jgi:hypothetical protein
MTIPAAKKKRIAFALLKRLAAWGLQKTAE